MVFSQQPSKYCGVCKIFTALWGWTGKGLTEVSWLVEKERCWHVRCCGPLSLCVCVCVSRIQQAHREEKKNLHRPSTVCHSPLVEISGPVRSPISWLMYMWHVFRSNGLARSTAALSLSVVLHHCDSVRWPIAVDWIDPHYTPLLFQSFSEPGHDSQTCRGSVSRGQQVSPWGLPCTGPWQEKSSPLAGFPPIPPLQSPVPACPSSSPWPDSSPVTVPAVWPHTLRDI